MSTIAPKGLQDVIANDSSICFIDGGKGILSYRGIDIHELAQKSSFEETTFLLWNGSLPPRRRPKCLLAPAPRRPPAPRRCPRLPQPRAQDRLADGSSPHRRL